MALSENADLKVAQARVQRARVRAGIASSQRFARLDGVTSGAVSRQNEEENPFRSLVNPDRSPMGFGLEYSWEIDWWGGKRRRQQAAGFEANAKEWDRAALQTEVVAAVVGEALEIQCLFHQVETMERIVDLETQSLGWMRNRLDRGEEVRSKFLDAERRLAENKLEAEKYRERLGIAQRALSEWCGREKVSIDFLRGNQDMVSQGPGGPLRAGVVLRRPDVAAATARYRRAVAAIGIAEASRWPEVQILGRFGQVSSSFSGIFENGATSYGLGPRLILPIFDAGEGRMRSEEALAAAEETHSAYAGAVLRALREVGTAADRLQSSRRMREEADRLYRIAGEQVATEEQRAKAGESSKEPTRRRSIDECRADIVSREIRCREDVATTDLYRALGGGWR
ncbi:TolC family protein [Akkermansiaceae bacterium]|nr:TolC family protein [Akkermansiaceae bacterium]